jgi:hypothetical protein
LAGTAQIEFGLHMSALNPEAVDYWGLSANKTPPLRKFGWDLPLAV